MSKIYQTHHSNRQRGRRLLVEDPLHGGQRNRPRKVSFQITASYLFSRLTLKDTDFYLDLKNVYVDPI